MKKIFACFFVSLLFFNLFSIYAAPAKFENKKLLNSAITIYDWNNSFEIKKSDLKILNPGDKIEFQFTAAKDTKYTRVFALDSNWNKVLFSNVVCSPKLPDFCYIVQEQTDEKTGKKFKATKISIPDYDSKKQTVYTVQITLNKNELKSVKENGFVLTGNNFVLKNVSLNIAKVETSQNDSLEQQYIENTETRNLKNEKYARYVAPVISITTKNNEPVKKKEYYESIIDVISSNSSFRLPEEISERKAAVKVRGNSTSWDQYSPTNKPYKIKFNKKQNLLGLHKGKKYKKWVLLKADSFNAADYLGFKLAEEIYKTSNFNYYTSDCAFVHVVINGTYMGQYLLCEQNQVASGRVDVTQNEGKSKKLNTGYFIELDNYSWDDLKDNKGRWFGPDGLCQKGKEEYHFTVKYLSENPDDNTEFLVWGNKQTGVKLEDVNGVVRGCPEDSFTIKSKIDTDEQCELVQKYVTGVWNICYRAIEKNQFYKFDSKYNLVPAKEFKTARQACEAVMDLESLCNEIILEELVRDNDVGCGSLYMAFDFTKSPSEKYGRFTFECPWDFNWAYQPIENDVDHGAFWNGKYQYFACAWQTLKISPGYDAERSHPWYILFNNAPWFRQMLREKWEQIGTENLITVANTVDEVFKNVKKDTGHGENPYSGFVKNRIKYIDQNFWK